CKRSGGAGRRGSLSAAARDRNSPEFAVYGVPGVNPTGVWLWGDLRDTRNLLAALSGPGGARNSERRGGGGSARRKTPASACVSSSRHGNGCEWMCVRTQDQSNTERGSE